MTIDEPVKNIARKPPARAGYARDLAPIPPAAAEAEPPAERVFTMPEATLPEPPTKVVLKPDPGPRPFAGRIYTIHAVSPQGFPIDLAFADISIAMLEEHIGKLITAGYTPPTDAAPATDPAGWRTLPDGTPLCPKHHVPMRKRERQGDAWWSHNAGAKDAPLCCKGYAGPDSPGYDVD